jgi:hypothetical protein
MEVILAAVLETFGDASAQPASHKSFLQGK